LAVKAASGFRIQSRDSGSCCGSVDGESKGWVMRVLV
jgi:hypothetical protein